MKTVPVVFAFDNNLTLPACVCISSLLKHANIDTFYDIFILHPEKEIIQKELFGKLTDFYKRCRLNYRAVGDVFGNAFEIRGITTPAYYRLLIPELIREYDKVIYADVDIIFRMDLSSLYEQDLGDYYIAATYDWGMILEDDGKKYIRSVDGLVDNEYIQSGFLIVNSKKIRDDGLVREFKKHAKRKYKFQDQDILNVVCGLKRKILPIKYNLTDYAFYYIMNDPERLGKYFSENELDEILKEGTLHYNGHKPWKKYSVNYDIWWEYYRKSPVFDNMFYFNFFHSKLNIFDQLTLWKRIKILLRYFIK